MELIKHTFVHKVDIEKYFNHNSCFFDIETTGLNRNKDIIYLIGLLYFNSEDHKWVLNQYFINSIDKEPKMLEKFTKDINSFDTIITYNGDSFDIPFVNHRLRLSNSNLQIDKNKSFDLYRFIRNNRLFLNLENLKLKTIEESLGYFREDIFSGYDCIGFYKDYIKSNNPIMKERVLKHNHDDLIHMLDILEIIDIIKYKKTIKTKNIDLKMESIYIEKNKLIIKGRINSNLDFDIVDYNIYYNFITNNKNEFHISMDLNKGLITEEITAFYISLKSFGLKNLISSFKSKYSLIPDIYLVSIENKLLIKEIKKLLSYLIESNY